MTTNDGEAGFAVERGSGNVFADLGLPDAETLQLKAQVAAEILKVLDRRKLTASQAARITGMDVSDFSRVRHGKLLRLSIDRLLRMAERLGRRPKISFAKAA